MKKGDIMDNLFYNYLKFLKRFSKINEEFLAKFLIIFLFIVILTFTSFDAQEVGQTGEYTLEKVCYNNPECNEVTQNDNIVYQSLELFEEDNLNYRGNENIISYKGEYIDYHNLEYGIVFITEDLRDTYKSGDKIYYNGEIYVVIDNKSNCQLDNCFEFLI